jgi:hypothetical protein
MLPYNIASLPANHLIRAVNAVNAYSRMAAHHSAQDTNSLHWLSTFQSSQQLPAVAPAQNAGRRVGAGAGATPVFVAMIRHDTSLVRWLSLVGRSRTCPSSLILNPNDVRIENKSLPGVDIMATVIPKQAKKERDQITIRLDRDVVETLEHYCRYLESSRDWVINQCRTFIFRQDKPLTLWLAGHCGKRRRGTPARCRQL